MNKFLLIMALLALPPAALSQDDASADAERSRIAVERGQVEAEFRAGEKACYGKFAVNQCLNEARERRRAILADLRRQEVSVNDAQRKRKAAERVRAVEERAREKREQAAAQREKAAGDHKAREERGAQKASGRAASEASQPARATQRQEQARKKQDEKQASARRREADAAQAVKRGEQRVMEARERKAALDKRLAERKKPAAQPLPVPP